jgi:hypothetical protein
MADEMAVLMVNEEYGKRDTILQERSPDLQRIHPTHRAYDVPYPIVSCLISCQEMKRLMGPSTG